MAMIFCVVFLTYGAVVLERKGWVHSEMDRQCSNPTSDLADLDRVYYLATQYLCTSKCPCNASKLSHF